MLALQSQEKLLHKSLATKLMSGRFKKLSLFPNLISTEFFDADWVYVTGNKSSLLQKVLIV